MLLLAGQEEEKVWSWCGLGFDSKLIGLRDPVEVISVETNCWVLIAKGRFESVEDN